MRAATVVVVRREGFMGAWKIAPATRARRARSGVAQRVEERRAVALELHRPHAWDLEQLALRARPARGHAAERGIAEDDVGRHALGVGEPLAHGAEFLEQRLVLG